MESEPAKSIKTQTMPLLSTSGGAASPLGRRQPFVSASKAFAVCWIVLNWFDCLCMLIVFGLTSAVSAASCEACRPV